MTNETPPGEVTIPIATEFKHYELGGHDGWWLKITKKEAEKNKFARQSLYGNDSLGWFTPVELGRT